MKYILGSFDSSFKFDKERERLYRKFSWCIYAALFFFLAETIVKLFHKEYDFVVYIGIILYVAVLGMCVNFFIQTLRKNKVFDIILILLALFMIGFIVADIVYLITPQLTIEQKFEQIINSQ
ncbi:lipopolysaccharide export LptBFGC system permease protein LptF [Dysgonomonas sp. PH5-45]|uniref:hypothetical protein n=1 Tax=unclassified Dysgonomonas TaxID=2630389 RepID=UPI002474268A|nr:MULTISPECIES: hypothetical protein [unclassified Dysgonomonas]MDH6354547.1 lipopolysaccharide export LptBFGC system permease protein LptF [Dysgonomonas sp. PH5-45]MDH6387397.1 lipopolysaccharide export LptBFGC system permease protein LptF [Dysgonomonas sp. PH5-37]